ncbi:hypothetical protein PTKIN_Ptkin06aG0172500 [Pterospermum kingtungense]
MFLSYSRLLESGKGSLCMRLVSEASISIRSLICGALPCERCDMRVEAGGSQIAIFYACVQCDFILHFRCASIPFGIKHDYHTHQLKLNHSFIENVSADDEYYCDICEKERNPKDSVYCCEKCTFVAHIGCALHKFMDHGSISSLVDSEAWIMKPLEQEDTQNTKGNFSTHLKQFIGKAKCDILIVVKSYRKVRGYNSTHLRRKTMHAIPRINPK